MYLIWSFKHAMWWRPNRMGYTPNLEDAGRYTHKEAGDIVTGSIMGESVCLHEDTASQMGAPTVRGLWAEKSPALEV